MSTTTTTAPTAASTCTLKLYDIPTSDAACAMPMNSTYKDLMATCCGAASVTPYSDCDYYCLAQGQTVGDLAECLIRGSEAGQVWCNTNVNATATATLTTSATGTGSEDAGASPTGMNGAGVVSVKSVGVLVLLVLGGVRGLA
ncbi:hypothetical protein BDW62DRAFT_206227 [Aspergillus aurantiobrunneus]